MTTTIKYLIKFGDEANIIKLFEKGEIYMNTIKSFKQSDRKEIGDKYEGTVDIKNFHNGELTLYLPDNPITLKTSKLQLSESYKNHIGNIFCSYALSDKLLYRKPVHKIDSRMQTFGSHCIIIKDVSKFLNAIFSELKNRNIDYSHNIVKYHNYNKNDHQLTLFDKPHNYAYQKEHRIIAYTDLDEPLKFEIGSIKEYAEIYETNVLIKNLILAPKNYIT
ncbi:hypothetical protein [Flavobacterium sp. 14A]|uniref:hypothetical protein n=1 Tax=Flavobacterium sp. 14A TaxID=2735896 RepID=UPI00156EE2B8|nr:hypothetical protein [Flavobacterium sp. 14A]NRT13601.1 hypothetical protein [Flavobacterium sp. 14A]